jgi:hypothetical protein
MSGCMNVWDVDAWMYDAIQKGKIEYLMGHVLARSERRRFRKVRCEFRCCLSGWRRVDEMEQDKRLLYQKLA